MLVNNLKWEDPLKAGWFFDAIWFLAKYSQRKQTEQKFSLSIFFSHPPPLLG